MRGILSLFTTVLVFNFVGFLSSFSISQIRVSRKLSGDNSGLHFSRGALSITFDEDIVYVISINFQLKFQTETVEIKQLSIFIFGRNSQTMQVFIPKINATQYMLWGAM